MFLIRVFHDRRDPARRPVDRDDTRLRHQIDAGVTHVRVQISQTLIEFLYELAGRHAHPLVRYGRGQRCRAHNGVSGVNVSPASWMLSPMRLASDCRVGYAVRMSRLVSSRSATASHMSFGTSGVEALLARLLVDTVKTRHLLDLEAQHLHGVRVGDRRRPPASRELVLDGLLRLPVMFGELFHRHQVWYRRTHWGILSSGISFFAPVPAGAFPFLRNLAVVDGHGIEPWSRSLPRIHDLRDLDWGQPAPPEAGRRRIDQSRRPTGPRKPTPYLSVVFSVITRVIRFSFRYARRFSTPSGKTYSTPASLNTRHRSRRGTKPKPMSAATPFSMGCAHPMCVITQPTHTANTRAQKTSRRMNRFDGPPSAVRKPLA
nr:MAG TPA: hypothetical protein [Caudoviricetes sp.]